MTARRGFLGMLGAAGLGGTKAAKSMAAQSQLQKASAGLVGANVRGYGSGEVGSDMNAMSAGAAARRSPEMVAAQKLRGLFYKDRTKLARRHERRITAIIANGGMPAQISCMHSTALWWRQWQGMKYMERIEAQLKKDTNRLHFNIFGKDEDDDY